MDDVSDRARPKRSRRSRSASEDHRTELVDVPALEAAAGFVVLKGESLPEATLASREIHQGGIGRVFARDVTVGRSVIGGARADRVSVSQGALGGALADTVSLYQGAAGAVIAREARVDQSIVGRLIAQDVHVERPSAVLVLIAQRASGDIRVLFDWKSALALGGAIGLVSGLVRRITRRNG